MWISLDFLSQRDGAVVRIFGRREEPVFFVFLGDFVQGIKFRWTAFIVGDLIGVYPTAFGAIDLRAPLCEAATKRIALAVRFREKFTELRLFLYQRLRIAPSLFLNIKSRNTAEHPG